MCACACACVKPRRRGKGDGACGACLSTHTHTHIIQTSFWKEPKANSSFMPLTTLARNKEAQRERGGKGSKLCQHVEEAKDQKETGEIEVPPKCGETEQNQMKRNSQQSVRPLLPRPFVGCFCFPFSLLLSPSFTPRNVGREREKEREGERERERGERGRTQRHAGCSRR